MGQRIEFVGRLSMPKETEKFKPFEERTFDSGWKKKALKLNMVCGTNRHLLSLEAGCYADGHNDIYLYSKGSQDDNGNKVKGESFTIKFADRLTSNRLPEVAEFKKFILDLDEKGRRYKLNRAINDMKDGKDINNILIELKLDTESLLNKELSNTKGNKEVIANLLKDFTGGEDISKALSELKLDCLTVLNDELDKSNKRRHEYVSEWDLIDALKKIVDSGKYDKKKFKVIGEQITEYSDFSDKYYTKFVPQKIYLVPDDEEETSHGTVEFFYTGEAFDDSMVEEKGKYYINGYGLEYNRQLKKNVGYPITLAMPKKDDEKAEQRLKVYRRFFTTEEGTYKKMGVEVEFIDGAPKIAITDDLLMEMLTEDQLDLLMLEEVTLDDLRKEMGLESTYGDRITETQFEKLAKGFSKGGEATIYTDETFEKPIKAEEKEEVSDDLDIDDLDLDAL